MRDINFSSCRRKFASRAKERASGNYASIEMKRANNIAFVRRVIEMKRTSVDYSSPRASTASKCEYAISVCVFLSPQNHFTPYHFTRRSFHPTFISPQVHFTPHSFHLTFISTHFHSPPYCNYTKASHLN